MAGSPAGSGSARTWLFVPAHDERKLDKGWALVEQGRCDRLLLDWEDAVPRQCKTQARELTRKFLQGLEAPRRLQIAVRIHDASTAEFEEDLEALAGWLLGAVVLPKVEGADQVRRCAELELPIVALIESARGVQSLSEITAADRWLRGLAVGLLDLLADLRVEWTPESPILAAVRQQMVIAGRAAGVEQLLLGPYPDLNDLAGLRRDSEAGRRVGCTGRLLIHPKQLETVAEVFLPSTEQLAFARRVLEVWRAAPQTEAALQVDGRFVDAPVVRWARELLASSAEKHHHDEGGEQ
jgi:citrate lyase subunit beta/citryl-CoA lyase